MSDTKFWILFLGAVLLITSCAVGLGIGLDWVACNAKTSQIGFPAKYSIFGGCLVEVKPSQWIPLENYYFKQQ